MPASKDAGIFLMCGIYRDRTSVLKHRGCSTLTTWPQFLITNKVELND
jgi:hypothetical protein